MERKGMQWTAMLLGITEGEHVIDIKPADTESFTTTIKIVGIGSNSNINDIFDL